MDFEDLLAICKVVLWGMEHWDKLGSDQIHVGFTMLFVIWLKNVLKVKWFLDQPFKSPFNFPLPLELA